MKFGDPGMLKLLWLLPVFLFLFARFNRQARKRMESFAGPEAFKKLMYLKSPLRRRWKMAAFLSAFALLSVALARPQMGVEPTEVKQLGTDVLVALDTSLSMAAEDLAPSRFAKAKREIEKIAGALAGNRLALLVFAGESVVECPFTLDVSTFKMFLNSISVNSIPVPGTDISGAIQKAMELFKNRRAKSKVMVLLTDGEDHEGDPVALAKEAAKEGITIFTVGLGSGKGAPIPMRDGEGNLIGYKKDRNGEMVFTVQNSSALNDIALFTDGIFVSSEGGALDTSPIVEAIRKMEKSDITSTRFTSYVERFQLFLGFALVLLIVEWAI